MKFTKMHGIGNDYVYVNCFQEKILNPQETAWKISNRHKGIGADGLILIGPSEKADFSMKIYNADGSQAEMCGNGIRCVAKYLYEKNLTKKTEIDIETLAGIKHVWLYLKGDLVQSVKVDMGYPILLADQIPIISEQTKVIHEKIMINRMEYYMTGVSMGNPHVAVFVNRVNGVDIQLLGPGFEYHGRFPRRVNVEFVQVDSPKEIQVRVWERGAGETLACGTGACAAVVAGVLNHLTERKVNVKLKGGDLTVHWKEEDGKVYMTGPAEFVYEGQIEI